MTISSTVRIAGPYIGSGAATVFPFAFKVFAAAEMQVAKLNTTSNVETILVLNTDYTVQLNGDQNGTPGGTITLPAVLASGYNLTITSDIANLQPTDLTNQGGFYPEVITDALDRATIQIQQLDQNSRAIKIPLSDGVLDMTTPVVAARQGKYLAFDSLGLPVVSSGTGSDSALRTDLANATAVSAGSRLSGFRQTGTGAVARTVDAKLKDEPYSIEEFAVGAWTINSVLDATPTLNAALEAIKTSTKTKTIYFPPGSYSFLTRPNDITSSTNIVGSGTYTTYCYKQFVSATSADGIFNIRGGSGQGSLSSSVSYLNMTAVAPPISSGGCLISVVSSPTTVGYYGTCGYLSFNNLYLTDAGDGYDYAVYLNGSNPGSQVRSTSFMSCEIFGGLLGTLYMNSCAHTMFTACSFIDQGGTSGAITITGTITNPNIHFGFYGGRIGALNLDYAVQGCINAASISLPITNTANTQYISINTGYWAGAQNNWLYSSVNTGTNGYIGRNVTGLAFPTGSDAFSIACAGAVDGSPNASVSVPIGQSVRFNSGTSKLVTVSASNGWACLIHADYVSGAVTLLSNPSGQFTNAVGTPDRISITKAINSSTIRVMNEFAAGPDKIINICVFGTTPNTLTLGV